MLSLSDIVNVKVGIGRGVFEAPGATVIGGKKPSFNLEILKLFANGEQGFFYDPNDLTTMFQDAAGTIPITAVGQPVGMIKDKSGRNNHAFQTVSASRPLLGRHPVSGARNLTTHSNNPNEASWVFIGGVRTANQLDSRGGYTAARFQGPSSSNTNKQARTLKGGAYTYTVCLKAGPQHTAKTTLLLRNAATSVNYQTGVVDLATGVITGAGWSSKPKPNGFWECTFTQHTGISTGDLLLCYFGATDVTTAAFDIIVDYMQIEAGEVSTPFQETVSLLDITEKGVPTTYYLNFDGVDDFLQTSNIDFTATDKVSLFAGVRKLSDTASGMVCELSVNSFSTDGSFYLATPVTASPLGADGFNLRGTISSNKTYITISPASVIYTGIGDIGGKSIIFRTNGVTRASGLLDFGTGNLRNHPLYIGRRAGSLLPLNGHIYSLIGVGRLTTDNETMALEKELAKRTGVSLNV